MKTISLPAPSIEQVVQYFRELKGPGKLSIPPLLFLEAQVSGSEKYIYWNEFEDGEDELTLQDSTIQDVLAQLGKQISTEFSRQPTIQVPGFAVFHQYELPGKEGKNPRTGESIVIAPRKILTFFPTPGFLNACGFQCQLRSVDMDALAADPQLEKIILDGEKV